jgi:hypothetical protein
MMIVQEELSGPGDTAPPVVSKAPIKMRQSKSRPASSVQNAMMSGGMLPQQLAVYQPTPVPPQPHQFMVQFKLCLIHCSALVKSIFMKFNCWHFITKNTANVIGPYPEAVHVFPSLLCPSTFSFGHHWKLLAFILYTIQNQAFKKMFML